MNASEDIKKEFASLLDKQADLLNLVEDDENSIEFGVTYQDWYSRACKVVELLAPERLEEFTSYYLIDPKRKSIHADNYVIQDHIRGTAARKGSYVYSGWNPNDIVSLRIANQLQILMSLDSRIDSVLQDVTGHLFAELQDSELAAAAQLKKVSKRAAGALAGVVLERHLQRVIQNHSISMRKKSPSISDLNDPLKNAGVYDVPTWRKIQLLADIRNLCAHQKNREPTDDELDEMISGVNSVIKSIF